MPTTDNGWPAAPDLERRDLIVNGHPFVGGIADRDDVEYVFRYAMEQYAARVEPLVNPGCWGFAYRDNANDPTRLSRHSGGIAIDVNAPQHPNGVPTLATFTPDQIATCHLILAECHGALRWGGDYQGTPDAMHWEINPNPAGLAAPVALMQADAEGLDMTEDEVRRIIREELDAFGKRAGDAIKVRMVPDEPRWSLERGLRAILNKRG
jgi:hypothetical protein